ncbi:hypothetical protein QDR37_05855 [Amnibacterium sp. CER49]|uniref:hypothetical protein n=1 Tax=Amnibacterium sp. CER49 TaxID=3039161 RepID=UPI002449C8F9|nr:hypothetical protein [Amnibacterium sp. CER49]MDH2443464.1 hypothetical protein [Amnibacterium sp. CER49]
MSDEQQSEPIGPSTGPATPPTPRSRGRDQTVFERFFPGPAPTDPRIAARLDALARAAERRASDRRRRPRSDAGWGGPAAPASPDLDQVVDALQEQTEVMRALLEADIAIRDDARATAQNSRTFAIAGTVIAFLTLVATAVTVVLAFAP